MPRNLNDTRDTNGDDDGDDDDDGGDDDDDDDNGDVNDDIDNDVDDDVDDDDNDDYHCKYRLIRHKTLVNHGTKQKQISKIKFSWNKKSNLSLLTLKIQD